MRISKKIGMSVLVLLLATCASLSFAEDETKKNKKALVWCNEDDQHTPDGNTFINDIIVDNRDVFDLNDPKENNFLYRLANKIHVVTKPKIIKKNILLQEGDAVSVQQMAESERILRNTSYIIEADLCLVPSKEEDKVDLKVTTRDLWTLQGDISFSRQGGDNSNSIGIEDQNIFGTGAAVAIGRIKDSERTSSVFGFENEHFLRRWQRFALRHADSDDGFSTHVSIGQPFYSLDTRFSWSAVYNHRELEQDIYDLGEEIDVFDDTRRSASFSLGFSKGLQHGVTHRYQVGFIKSDSQARAVAETSNLSLLPQNRDLAYPYIGYEYVEDKFITAENYLLIGREEDLFLGKRFNLQVGYSPSEWTDDNNAWIFSSSYNQGILRGKHLLLLGSHVDGLQVDNRAVNTLWSNSLRYFYRHSRHRSNFIRLAGSMGDNLEANSQPFLGGESGLRGYPNRFQRGNHRALLSLEQRYYSDWEPFHLVRVGAAIFYDIGRTWGANETGATERGWLQSAGIGLRLGSTKSSFGRVLHIDFVFPFDGEEDGVEEFELEIATKATF